MTVTMIDLALYRCRVGVYAGVGLGGYYILFQKQDYSVFSQNCPQFTKFVYLDKSIMQIEERVVHSKQQVKILLLFYLYLISIFALISLLMVHSVNFTTPQSLRCGPQSLHCGPGMWYLNCKMSFPTMAYMKVAYFYLIFYAIPRAMYICIDVGIPYLCFML